MEGGNEGTTGTTGIILSRHYSKTWLIPAVFILKATENATSRIMSLIRNKDQLGVKRLDPNSWVLTHKPNKQ